MILKNIRYVVLFILKFLASAMSVDNIKDCLNDQRGGLVLPISGNALNDSEWLEYQKLTVDCSVKPISPYDLPDDFCLEACRLVDEFRRKTVNEDVEWMLYFDYRTGDVIYCWKGEGGKCDGAIAKIHFYGKDIASVHNHPKGYYSFLSPNNFEILEKDFEDYELISSVHALWIIKFNGAIDKRIRYKFQKKLILEMNAINDDIRRVCSDVDVINLMVEKSIGNYLLSSIEKRICGIDLIIIKREYN